MTSFSPSRKYLGTCHTGLPYTFSGDFSPIGKHNSYQVHILCSPIEEKNNYWCVNVFTDLRCPSRSAIIQSWFLFLSLVQLLDRGWCLYTLYHTVGTNYMSGLATCRTENPLLYFWVKRSSLPMIRNTRAFYLLFLF